MKHNKIKSVSIGFGKFFYFFLVLFATISKYFCIFFIYIIKKSFPFHIVKESENIKNWVKKWVYNISTRK